MEAHKNAHRAPLRPLDGRTLALSAGGLGFLRPAPGTWGSLPPLLIAVALTLADVPSSLQLAVAVALLVVSCVACVKLGHYAERRFGRKDAPEVVADEVAGVCVPVIAALVFTDDAGSRLVALALAFVLFRVFDILKPWPLKRLEMLPGGWGVLMDDIMAGGYAGLLVTAVAAGWL